MPDGARPGLLARFRLGSARHPHVLRVRSGGCALSARNLAAPPTALSIDLGELRMALWAWFKTSVMHFQLPVALQFM
ncbi:hypothetical protein EGO56_01640 [Pantoea vagans]|nr:hypothetical protein EGO56_01640 [Pantoea vagans]